MDGCNRPMTWDEIAAENGRLRKQVKSLGWIIAVVENLAWAVEEHHKLEKSSDDITSG